MAMEDAGGIEAQLRLELTQMQRDALEAQRKMDALAAKLKQQGETAGDGFAAGMGRGFNQTTTKWDMSVAKIKASLASLGPWGQRAGTTLANGLSKPVIAAVPKMAMAFRSLQAAMGPIMVVIGIITSAVMAIKGFYDKQNVAAKEAKEKQAEYNNVIQDTQREISRLNSLVGSSTTTLTVELNTRKMTAEQIQRQIDAQQKYVSLLRDTADSIEKIRFSNAAVGVATTNELVARETILRSLQERARQEDIAYNAAAAAYELNKNAVTLAEKDYQVAVRAVTVKEQTYMMQKARLEAEQEIYGVLLRQYTTMVAEYGLTSAQATDAKAKLDAQSGIVDACTTTVGLSQTELENLRKSVSEVDERRDKQAKMNEEIAAAQERYNETEREINLNKAKQTALGRDEAEAEKDAEESRVRASASLLSSLVAIKDKYDVTLPSLEILIEKERDRVEKSAQLKRAEEERERARLKTLKEGEDRNKAIISMEDEIARQKIRQIEAEAESEKNLEKKLDLMNEAVDKENALMKMQREREKQEMKQLDWFKNAAPEKQKEIESYFDTITRGMERAHKTIEDIKEKVEELPEQSWLATLFKIDDEELDKITQAGEAAISAFSDISGSILDAARKHAEEQIAGIEDKLKEMLDSIEEAREAQLIANGFAVQNNIESLEQQLEAAKRTGDEVLIYQAERRKKEQEINDLYDAQAKAAEDKAKKEKADIEFKLATEEHAMQIVQAVNAGIMAAMQALAAAPPPYNFVLAGLSAAATGAQIGLLTANPPKPPKFASGGIVPGNSYAGDKVPALVNSGELILSRSQQDSVAGQLAANSPVKATIVVMMDSREIAKSTVDMVNDGFYTIKARAMR